MPLLEASNYSIAEKLKKENWSVLCMIYLKPKMKIEIQLNLNSKIYDSLKWIYRLENKRFDEFKKSVLKVKLEPNWINWIMILMD
jgi:hypothetical protein